MTPGLEIHRGSIVLVRLDPHRDRTGAPAVVVSNEAACRADTVLQVVPLAGLPDRPLRPWEARIDPPLYGAGEATRALANQLRTVARHRLTGVLGRATAEELEAVLEAIRIQLGT